MNEMLRRDSFSARDTHASVLSCERLYTLMGMPFSAMFSARFWPITARPTRPTSETAAPPPPGASPPTLNCRTPLLPWPEGAFSARAAAAITGRARPFPAFLGLALPRDLSAAAHADADDAAARAAERDIPRGALSRTRRRPQKTTPVEEEETGSSNATTTSVTVTERASGREKREGGRREGGREGGRG